MIFLLVALYLRPRIPNEKDRGPARPSWSARPLLLLFLGCWWPPSAVSWMMEGQRRTLVSRPKIETMALELEGNWGWLVWEWESGKMNFFV